MLTMSMVREYVFKFLYHINLQIYHGIETSDLNGAFGKLKQDHEQLIEDFNLAYRQIDSEHPDNQLNNEIQTKAKKFILGIFDNIQELVDPINANVVKGSITKVEKVDLCCLLIGVYELKFQNTPGNVVVSEMVSIGKKYGGPASPSFLNGMLDKIKKEIKK